MKYYSNRNFYQCKIYLISNAHITITILIYQVQTNCQGDGYTLATRDDGQSICYFYMDRNYIKKHKPDDNDLNYEQSKQMCADKGTFYLDADNLNCFSV